MKKVHGQKDVDPITSIENRGPWKRTPILQWTTWN